MRRIGVAIFIIIGIMEVNYQADHSPVRGDRSSCEKRGGLRKPADQPKYDYGIVPILCVDGTVVDTKEAP